MYYEKDCDLNYLSSKKIAVMASSQGHATCPEPEGFRLRGLRGPAEGSRTEI